jgi:glycosyltransferase involved in cell wall biosynthesis
MTSQKPTILHVIDTTGPGGAETVFLDLAEHMAIDGFRNIALIKGPGWVQSQLESRRVPFEVIKPHGILSLPYYFAVFKLLKKHNVKFVQAHLLGSALTFSILSLITRIPVVATLHGQVDINPNERFVKLKRLLLKKGLKKVVTVSNQLGAYLVDRQLFDEEQLEVIHNGINVDRYNEPNSGAIKKNLNLGEDTKLVGSIGNIRPAKDYQTLIKAAANIIAIRDDVHFIVAGHSKKKLQSELDELVEQLGLSKHIHFVGFLDNTPEFLAQLDVFALSSSSEGFSIATLEAMAAQVPVVVTKCGGPEEIVRPEVDGKMVLIKDPDALSKALLELLKNDEGTAKVITSAKQRVDDVFSLNAMIKRYSKLALTMMPNNRSQFKEVL